MMQTGSDILAGDAAPAIAKRSRMGDFRTKDIIRTADVRRSNRPLAGLLLLSELPGLRVWWHAELGRDCDEPGMRNG